MAIPEPEPGLVIRYDFLWADDAAARRELGKDRPACLVAASEPTASPRFVVILPITHSRPRRGSTGIEIPAVVCRTLGLDEERSWVIVSESNIDEWPNAGLTPIPGRRNVFSYGFLPPRLFARIKAEFLARARRPTRRT